MLTATIVKRSSVRIQIHWRVLVLVPLVCQLLQCCHSSVSLQVNAAVAQFRLAVLLPLPQMCRQNCFHILPTLPCYHLFVNRNRINVYFYCPQHLQDWFSCSAFVFGHSHHHRQALTLATKTDLVVCLVVHVLLLLLHLPQLPFFLRFALLLFSALVEFLAPL